MFYPAEELFGLVSCALENPRGMELSTFAVSFLDLFFVSGSAEGGNCPVAGAGLQENSYTKLLAASILTAVTAHQATMVSS